MAPSPATLGVGHMEKPRERRADPRRLDHPIIDADGHAIEYLPVVRDILREQAGDEAVTGMDLVTGGPQHARAHARADARAALVRTSWWGLPARNTLDRGTALLPALLAERLDELGIDHAVLYPTYGLVPTALDDARSAPRGGPRVQHLLRGGVPRPPRDAHTGRHHPDAHAGGGDRGARPRDRRLGLKAFMFGGPIRRPTPGVEHRAARWLDSLGLDASTTTTRCGSAASSWACRPRSTRRRWGGRRIVVDATTSTTTSACSRSPARRWRARCSWAACPTASRRCASRSRRAAWRGGRACTPTSSVTGRSATARRWSTTTRRTSTASCRRLFEEYGSERYRERLDQLDDGLRFLFEPDESEPRRVRASGVRAPRTSGDVRAASTSGARPTTR